MLVHCDSCEKNVRVDEDHLACPHCGKELIFEINLTPSRRKEAAKERRRTGERVQHKTKSVYCSICERMVRVTVKTDTFLAVSPYEPCPHCGWSISGPDDPEPK